MIEDLEQMVARLKQQLRDSEHQRHKQLRVNAHDTHSFTLLLSINS